MSSKNKTKFIENKIPLNDFFSNKNRYYSISLNKPRQKKWRQDDKTSVNNQVM